MTQDDAADESVQTAPAERTRDKDEPQADAEGGQILTSDTVRGLVAGKKFLFSARGETAMRGFEDPVKLYELSWREAG